MTDTPPEEIDSNGIELVDIGTEVGQSFLDYAMSVIVARALPDARDGLKPVHRRILWSMFETGLRPDRGHVKCATVVGDVIAKYHPHGDSAVYDAMVRMGQDFSLRHTLVDPHGNFGSPGDRAAAYRYTECRLTELAMGMLKDINEDTVDFLPNFDSRHREPQVLPSRFPNLLANGSQGIAVGLATNIPPHNLGEVIDAAIFLLENSDATNDDLQEIIKGPDFPTGGIILGGHGISLAQETGKGQIKIRAVGEIQTAGNKTQIVFTELPYQVSVEAIEEKVHDQVARKHLQGLRAVRNESAKGKTRLVFDLADSANPSIVMNELYKQTPLQVSFAINMVALNDGVPLTMNLLQLLTAYTDHQKEVLRRRSEYRLAQNKARAHILEGLLKALDMIDEVIVAIRAADDRAGARTALTAEPFEFSIEQSNHILDMPLGRLTKLGSRELTDELEECRKKIAELEAILESEKKLAQAIIDELAEIREKHHTPRKTQIVEDPGNLEYEDLIEDEELVFMLSKSGYVKCVRPDDFRAQNRGGQGVTGSSLEEEDYVDFLIHTTAHSYLHFFTNKGKVYKKRTYEIPIFGRTARGKPLKDILQLEADEKPAAIIDTNGDYSSTPFLAFITKRGQIKKTKFELFQNVRRNGLKALKLVGDDELIKVLPIGQEAHICLLSREGKLVRFEASKVNPQGRNAGGVRGMNLIGSTSDNGVVAAVEVEDETMLLLITENGYGKRTDFSEFSPKGRGGKGMIAIKDEARKGKLASALAVAETDEILMMAQSGKLIRMPVSRISVQGRNATGVKLMNMGEDDLLTSTALIDDETE